MKNDMRRTLKPWIAAGFVAALMVTACGGGDGAQNGTGGEDDGDRTLTVSAFPFAAEEFEAAVITPFEEETGIDVDFVTGDSGDRINQLQINRENPDVDVILIQDLYSLEAEQDDLLDGVDADQITSLEEVHPFVADYPGESLPYTFTIPGILYNPESIEDPDFSDLWDDEFGGRVALPHLSATAGIPVLLGAAETFGSGSEDIEAGFQALEELSPSVLQFYTSTTELLSLMERGEVDIAIALDLFAYSSIEDGSGLEWAPIDVGQYISANTASVVAGSENTEEAHEFVDFLLSAETQGNLAVDLHDKPVNTEAEVPDIMVDVTGEEILGNPEDAGYEAIDLEMVIDNRSDWLDEFNRRVAN